MKIQRKSSGVIALVFSVIISNSVFAWDDKVTHPGLTEEAVKLLRDNWFAPYLQNNFGFKENVNEKLPYSNKENRMSGGVGGSRGAIPVTRPDHGCVTLMDKAAI